MTGKKGLFVRFTDLKVDKMFSKQRQKVRILLQTDCTTINHCETLLMRWKVNSDIVPYYG